MSSGMVPLELSKDNNQYCKISVFMPNAGSINESVISVTNVGGDSFSVAVSMIRWNANKVFCKLINGTKISNINILYVLPRHTDITIKYKIGLYRNDIPDFATISISDFANITGNIITPTAG